ncbi:restriction endonuclease subunit S [Vibrio mediterranei]|uniref:restriction endonuclease subunit S n=1 Tax=Vibrio mediterranei TaxID=689 RepID=UPI00406982CA
MVPNSWKNQSPTSLFKLFSGFAFKSTDAQESGTKWLKIANVGIGEIKWDADSFLPEHFLLEHKKFALSKGDIVVALTRPTLGNKLKVARLTKESDTSLLNQRVAKIVCKEDADSEFVFQLLRSDEFAYRINVGLLGTDPPNLSVKVLEDFTVGCPPLPEQRKIAKILSTWDKAISTTEKLIETSKQQKKALMQQLLTGKKRLVNPETGKAFEGEWEDKYLNDFSKVIVSPVDKKTVEGEIPVELCNYTDVYYNTNITQKLTFMKATAKQSEIDKFTLEVDDVIITKDSETPGDIAVPALVSEDLNGVVCGYHLAIVRTDKQQADGAFINYLFSMPKTRYYFFTLATGATRFGLSIGGINKAHFCLPPLSEQQKIASVLTAADKEIGVLKAKLAHFKQEKKALMQKLLTGKRRVKVDEEVAA